MLPLLLVLLFGIVEFGIAFNRAQAVEAAAREGARLASISTTDAAAVTARVNATLAGIPLDNAPVITTPDGLCPGREGQQVTVRVEALHNVNIPLVWDRNVNLTGEAVFRCEA